MLHSGVIDVESLGVPAESRRLRCVRGCSACVLGRPQTRGSTRQTSLSRTTRISQSLASPLDRAGWRHAPMCPSESRPYTASPTLHLVTPSPISRTIPDTSWPARAIIQVRVQCLPLLRAIAYRRSGGLSSGTEREWQRVSHDELHHALANLPECVNVL